MNEKEFGEYIKKLRNEKKISMRKLAIISGVSNAHLSHLENGTRKMPKPDTILKLATALNVPYETLMLAAGHSRDEDTALVELAKKLNELMKTSKHIELKDFTDYKFTFDGKDVPPEVLKMMLDQIAFLLASRDKKE